MRRSYIRRLKNGSRTDHSVQAAITAGVVPSDLRRADLDVANQSFKSGFVGCESGILGRLPMYNTSNTASQKASNASAWDFCNLLLGEVK